MVVSAHMPAAHLCLHSSDSSGRRRSRAGLAPSQLPLPAPLTRVHCLCLNQETGVWGSWDEGARSGDSLCVFHSSWHGNKAVAARGSFSSYRLGTCR